MKSLAVAGVYVWSNGWWERVSLDGVIIPKGRWYHSRLLFFLSHLITYELFFPPLQISFWGLVWRHSTVTLSFEAMNFLSVFGLWFMVRVIMIMTNQLPIPLTSSRPRCFFQAWPNLMTPGWSRTPHPPITSTLHTALKHVCYFILDTSQTDVSLLPDC